MNIKTDQKSDRGQEKPLIGRATFANGEIFEYTDPAEFLQVIREELPYHPTSGFHYKVLTDDPKIRKAVDDILCDLYGEENPRTLEDYQSPPTVSMSCFWEPPISTPALGKIAEWADREAPVCPGQ